MSDDYVYDVSATGYDDGFDDEGVYTEWDDGPSLENADDSSQDVNISQACPGGFFYTIAAGDTLFALAARYGTTVDAILRANPGINPNQLFIGQRICIPVRRPVPRPPIPGIGGCRGGFPYVIVAGDTLYSIAARYGTTVAALLRANPGINPDQLFVGQRICIPVRRPQPPGPGSCRGGFFYTVAAGDTLFALAARYGTTVDAILRANPGINPNQLFIGQRICIPVPRPQPGPGPGPLPCPGGTIHIIAPGDTLFALASRYGVSVDAIIRANPGIDPNSLAIGRRICIPAQLI
ncbi:MAG: LysM peptidoglycan-binding domain-containing protein [Firmicutes bacterium]|nr:LysM peptidoglycan-binding domain-containing protein [Bacillota bacterium]